MGHETAFKQLLIVDSLRGAHSAGIAAVNNLGALTLSKGAMLPHYLLNTPESISLFAKSNRALIGHNRFATRGAVNNKNAHPFAFKHIVGAHNGSLIDMKKLPEHVGHEVDSQALLSSIDKFGTEGVEEKIHGAFALTWWDNRSDSMHFWRNPQRPLWLARTEDKKALFWCSEADMLMFVLNRNNIKYEKPWELEPHKEYTYYVDMAFNKEVSDPLIEDRKHFEPPPVQWQGQSNNYSDNWQNSNRRRFGYEDTEDYAGWGKEELPFEKKEQPLMTTGGTGSHQRPNHLSLVRDVVEGTLSQDFIKDQELSLRLRRLVDQSRQGSS